MLMRIDQTYVQVTQYTVADLLGRTPYLSRQVDRVLHHQHRPVQAHTKELYGTQVVQSTKELTFTYKMLQHGSLFQG